MQILILEENTRSAELAAEKLSVGQHHVQIATSLAAGEILFCSKRFDVIICALHLPDGSGLDFWNFCRFAKIGRYRFPFFVFTQNETAMRQDLAPYWEQLWLGATAILPSSNFETKLWNLLKTLASIQHFQQYRMQPRIDVYGNVDIIFDPHKAPIAAKVKNLSTRGILVESPVPLWIGQSITLQGEMLNKPFRLTPGTWQVRWNQALHEGHYLVGLYLQDVLDNKKIEWCEKINQMVLAA